MEKVPLLLQQQLHLGMLQAGRVSALPPPQDGPSPWGSTAHGGSGVPDKGQNPGSTSAQHQHSPGSHSSSLRHSHAQPQHLPLVQGCPSASSDHGRMAAQPPRHTGDTSSNPHPRACREQLLSPQGPHTHPQHGDHGGVSETPILILEVVSLRPLVPLADLPQLHCLIWGGERRALPPELP